MAELPATRSYPEPARDRDAELSALKAELLAAKLSFPGHLEIVRMGIPRLGISGDSSDSFHFSKKLKMLKNQVWV